jgi:hypothetical protein
MTAAKAVADSPIRFGSRCTERSISSGLAKLKGGREDFVVPLGLVTGTARTALEKEERRMAEEIRPDAPDVEGHGLVEAEVEAEVERADDDTPDVEGHGLVEAEVEGLVEGLVE